MTDRSPNQILTFSEVQHFELRFTYLIPSMLTAKLKGCQIMSGTPPVADARSITPYQNFVSRILL